METVASALLDNEKSVEGNKCKENRGVLWIHLIKEKHNYNKGINFCLSLIGFEKKNFFGDFKIRDITCNETFWNIVKPSFTNTIRKSPYNDTYWNRSYFPEGLRPNSSGISRFRIQVVAANFLWLQLQTWNIFWS